MKIYHYTVIGSGSFPADMLRYDKCWPTDGDSVIKLVGYTVRWEINLASTQAPTEDRWLSFGCAVQNMREVTT
jgi:hypothetical protein